MITVEGLVFEYPGVRALDGVGFALAGQSITALVGPNGAGKSTLMRCIAGLERPLAGAVRLGGLEVAAAPREVHRRIGFLSDFYGLYDGLSVRQCLLYRAGAMGLESAERPARAAAAAERCGVARHLSRKAGELSRGQRQRLAIAQALVHGPEVLLLDEPAAGLDPLARQALSRLLRALRDDGLTIVVSSHILSELEDYSTHMLALDRGRVRDHRAIGQPGGDGEPVRVRLVLAAPDGRLAGLLEAEAEITDLRLAEGEASFTLPGDPARRAALLRRLMDGGLDVAAFNVGEETMAEAYEALMEGGAE